MKTNQHQTKIRTLEDEIRDIDTRIAALRREREQYTARSYAGDAEAQGELARLSRGEFDAKRERSDLESVLRQEHAKAAKAERDAEAAAVAAARQRIVDRIDLAGPVIEEFEAAISDVEKLTADLVKAMAVAGDLGRAVQDATAFGSGALNLVGERVEAWVRDEIFPPKTHHFVGPIETKPLGVEEKRILGDHLTAVRRSVDREVKVFDNLDPATQQRVAAGGQ